VIPKPKNAKPFRPYPCVAFGIIRLLLTMLTAIDFNHQVLFQTDKINDKATDGALPSKFVSAKLTKAKVAPENSLSIGWIVSQYSGSCN